jgi:hypothetical protein
VVVIICATGQLLIEGAKGGSANSEEARTSVSPLSVVVTTRLSSVVICHDEAAALMWWWIDEVKRFTMLKLEGKLH